MVVLSIFISNCEKLVYLADISRLNKHQLFIFVPNILKRELSSDKLRLHRYLLYNEATRWTCYFVVFGIFSFPKKTNFPSSTKSKKKKFDLQTFHSKMFIWIFKKTRFVVYYFYIQEIWNFIFLISRICANDYCSIANWGYIN